MRVLVVEDEPKMAGLLRRGLAEEGVLVDLAADGERALAATAVCDFDVVVLDVMLPGANGFEVCAALRRRGVWAPVLILTARDGIADRVRGLDGGADDYLTKPFAFAELLARLRALVRRGPLPRPTVLVAGDLRLDPATRQVWRGNREIELTSKEYLLLAALLRHPGAVFTGMRSLNGPGTSPTSSARMSSMSTSVTSGRRSTGRSGSVPSKPCGARGIGCAATAAVPALGRD